MSIFEVAFYISTRVDLFETRMEEMPGGNGLVDVLPGVFLIVNFAPLSAIFFCLLFGFPFSRTVI